MVFCELRQIHLATWDKYILQLESITFFNLSQIHFAIWDKCLVWWSDCPNIIFPCMEYKTYGDKAVILEKLPISSFGPSIKQSIILSRWSVQEILAHLKIAHLTFSCRRSANNYNIKYETFILSTTLIWQFLSQRLFTVGNEKICSGKELKAEDKF